MKKIVFFLIAFISSSFKVNAQKGITKDFTIQGDLRLGANYLPLPGVYASKNMMLYTEIMAIHKTGLGIGYYAFDDFTKEATGRIRYVDAVYDKKWKNYSLYSAARYLWYDNYSEGNCWKAYVIGTYKYNTWSFQFTPMFTYLPHKDTDKYGFMAYGKVMKDIFKDVNVYATIWYDNLYNANTHFYGVIGSTIAFPKSFYLTGNLLIKDKKAVFLLNVGWKFKTTN